MFYLKPFDNRFDGLFTRNSAAWFTDDAGVIRSAPVAHQRRIVTIAAEPWIWIEGARQNHIESPNRVDNVADWAFANADTTANLLLPDGETDTVGVQDGAADTVGQTFCTTSELILATVSAYLRSADGVARTTDLNVVNGVPSTAGTLNAPAATWERGQVKSVSLQSGSNKIMQFANATGDVAIWGAQAETQPGFFGDAAFASQPILVSGVRAAELFRAGIVNADMISKTPRTVRVRFRPEFNSTDTTNQAFILVAFETGADATTVVIWIEATGVGTCRARAGFATGTFVASPNITFSAGQSLTFELILATGSLTVTGATTGNGTTLNGAYTIPVGAVATVGSRASLSAPAFSLIAPLEIGFDDITVVGIDQLTRNSARITFSDDVKQFDPNGIKDALNPNHYDVGGTPGWPFVQYVARGDTAQDVVLFFDAVIAPETLIAISVHDIVGDPVAIGVLPSTVQFIAFGDEVSPAAVREASYPRVDLANPQTETDAQGQSLGTLQVTDAGDLGNDFGRPNLRKRIFRRLGTMKRGFYHLPGYGLDVRPGKLFTETSLRSLRKDIEAQARSEPGVLAARASIAEVQPGIVAMKLAVQDDNGSFEMSGELDFSGALNA